MLQKLHLKDYDDKRISLLFKNSLMKHQSLHIKKSDSPNGHLNDIQWQDIYRPKTNIKIHSYL